MTCFQPFEASTQLTPKHCDFPFPFQYHCHTANGPVTDEACLKKQWKQVWVPYVLFRYYCAIVQKETHTQLQEIFSNEKLN